MLLISQERIDGYNFPLWLFWDYTQGYRDGLSDVYQHYVFYIQRSLWERLVFF
jgi:hypothetical protein